MFSRSAGFRRSVSNNRHQPQPQPPGLEVIQSGLLGLRRSLGRVQLLRTLDFHLDFSSLQALDIGQRLRLVFHGGKGRLREFCGYIVACTDRGQEHEYSVALEAEDYELEELRLLAQVAGAGLSV